MRIVAADTGGAVLDDAFQPLGLIATVAVLVEKPYKTASEVMVRFADPYNYDLSGRQAIRDEMELAIELAKKVKPDVIHLDSTLGGIEVRKLDEPTIDALGISDRGKEVWKDLSKDLQPLAKKFWEETGIEVVAIGKSSVPIRIAEIYSGIYSAVWAFKEAQEKGHVIVGLPRYMEVKVEGSKLVGRSLDPREYGLFGVVEFEVPEGLKWEVYPNPLVRRFLIFEVTSKH
ncbi:hypothetical protein A3L04_00880 [Thermococcus chitonophagus]|uniref:Uncharacterized protein n=1 Tax=Thermococcus chitonophagus TaxID=54262 RepID=A0A160VQ57_9EURY|nr:DUF4152 family protein [Thermococcus chitonophagus]ASJ15728.1 hypothetical protein A3L04_00880 [Thermococcus chitonophagus]CUX76947.1 hypothetical protein CHITON_0168 [Thermococcus chitonophagus]